MADPVASGTADLPRGEEEEQMLAEYAAEDSHEQPPAPSALIDPAPEPA
jgi:hypothetical protein